MQLEKNEIHIWHAVLTATLEQEKESLLILSPDEVKRAERFRFSIHRKRFIIARSGLRQILSFYLNTAPQKLAFSYNPHRKPSLAMHSQALQFNLAHSHDMAVYAITQDHDIGIDIEKIQNTYNPAVAKRFFSTAEYKALMQLPENERTAGFYRLWSRKEACIKAVGKGLHIPLSSFSVSIDTRLETITLEHQQWSLLSFTVHTDFQSAVATHQPIKKISSWHLFEQTAQLDRVSLF